MAYTFVAAPDHWPRNGVPIKAIVIHMAEGGGTVSWLTRNDGNSSHYVVEYSGRIVQMVREDRAAGSLNPSHLRSNDDAAFMFLGESVQYGYTAAKRALGSYYSNPNAAVIAIEVEGYAGPNTATKANPLGGPNAEQREALKSLVADIRSRHGNLPCLGHRDFQNYKACPGKRIPWVDYGGHGKAAASPTTPPQETDIVKSFTVPEQPTLAAIKTGTWLYDNSELQPSSGNIQISPGRELRYVGRFSATPDIRIVGYETAAGDDNSYSKAMFVAAEGISGYRVVTAPADTTPYSQAQLDKAVADAKAAAMTTINEQAATISTLKTELAAAVAASEEYTTLRAALKKAVA